MASTRAAEWSYDIRQDALSWSKDLSNVVDLGKHDKFSLEGYLNHVHVEDRKELDQSFRAAIRNGHALDVEYRLIDSSGKEHWVLHLGIACKGQKESNTLRGVLRDITELKTAAVEAADSKKRIALIEGEVLESKEGLKDFTYHASHDLHAPLRSIIGFSELVLDDYSDKIDSRGRDHLTRVVSQAKHLEEMLDDLLSLSRVMSHSVDWQKVELSRKASEIAQRNEHAKERPYEVDIQGDVSCVADPGLMEAALECLMDNAFKFSSGKPDAKIEFGMESVDGENQYYVRDNGVGFDMAYLDRLFKPFSKLHSSREFTGNGIGLAIVATVVKKHGGRIWVESGVDQGTTFYFVLGSPPAEA